MKQEFVTREQFQLYNQAIEREQEIDRIRSFMKWNYAGAIFSGLASLAAGSTANSAYHDGRPISTILSVASFLANAMITSYFITLRIPDKKEQIRETKDELDKITQSQEYMDLGLDEAEENKQIVIAER